MAKEVREYTLDEVKAHQTKKDLWVVIHGKVYDVTDYVRDHPGGADVLVDVAGTDATEAYEDVGHSEDANEILETYLVGTLKGAQDFVRKQAVRVIQPQPVGPVAAPKGPGSSLRALSVTAASIGSLLALYLSSRHRAGFNDVLAQLPHLRLPQMPAAYGKSLQGGFGGGFLVASAISAVVASVVASRLSKLTQIQTGFTHYPPHKKSRRRPTPNPHLVEGFLHPKTYQNLPLVRKDVLSSNVYRFVFQLPGPRDVIGLPIGQHVAIQAVIDGQTVSRSYTPTSNNLDLGRLELVIKCYPDGLLTGKYLANLEVGDHVQFRGPKGAMKYQRGLCRQIGMIAGGTGITPMYQLIRAICEDDTDTTHISLVYANRTEEDILLRQELDSFARRYPQNLKVWYMLDHPPQDWAYGSGYVTPSVMAEKLPAAGPNTKMMLCGPPGMVNAAKKGLVAAGYASPGAVAKMTDEIFCF
ncbi:hypothetical protein BDW42DRAFT_199917 [Aspergillus taichungensis]|uniref:Cytochrome b5 reductase n=1 Tax=Aspergillus taichungensis TaxID=482145 RepID=A0A2J5I2F0_9EURO|nr:hypothetical protein BDW42DRAFT_199917 [Aspergillus taichungensis]